MDVSSLLAQADNKGAMQISIDTVKELEYRFQWEDRQQQVLLKYIYIY